MLLERQNFRHIGLYSLDIGNHLDNIPVLLKSFEFFAQTYEVPQRLIPKVNAILTELVSGIVLYAYEKEKKEQIQVVFEILESGKFTLKIKYKGLAFNPFHSNPFDKNIPLEEREIGGLGLHLVQRLMDEYSYQRINEWNTVLMSKKEI